MTDKKVCTCWEHPGVHSPKINIELLRESLRIMHWDSEAIDFIVGAVEGKKS